MYQIPEPKQEGCLEWALIKMVFSIILPILGALVLLALLIYLGFKYILIFLVLITIGGVIYYGYQYLFRRRR